jgi:hypothetical protein
MKTKILILGFAVALFTASTILQNLLAGRNPQLAILYTLVMVTLVFIGGGKYSLDAKTSSNPSRKTHNASQTPKDKQI